MINTYREIIAIKVNTISSTFMNSYLEKLPIFSIVIIDTSQKRCFKIYLKDIKEHNKLI